MEPFVRYRALRRTATCVAVLSLLLATPARAQEATASGPGASPPAADGPGPHAAIAASAPTAEQIREARALFQLAHAHYDAGRYAEAAIELERALEIAPRPQLYFDLHLAYREMGDTERSASALRHFLTEFDAMEPEQRLTLERRLAALERTLAERAADQSAASATTTGAETTDQSAATDAALRAETVAAEGEPAAGVPEGVVAREDAGEGLSLAPGVVALTVGALALVGASIAGGVALGTIASRDAMCTLTATGAPGGTECPASLDQASFASRFELERAVAWGLAGGGAALAILGAVLTAVAASDDPPPGARPTVVAALCNLSGCVGTWEASF